MNDWKKEEVAREVRAALNFYRAMGKYPLEPPIPKEPRDPPRKVDPDFYCDVCDSGYCTCEKNEKKKDS